MNLDRSELMYLFFGCAVLFILFIFGFWFLFRAFEKALKNEKNIH